MGQGLFRLSIVTILLALSGGKRGRGDQHHSSAAGNDLEERYLYRARHGGVYSDDTTSDSTAPWIAKLFQQAGKETRHVFPANYAKIIVRHAPGTDTLGSDGYRLTITKDNITIEAQTTTGQFYAVQSLRQMLPPEVERGSGLVPSTIKLNGVAIVDNKSRLGYRGTMLDMCRHFISLNYVRETIDRMALLKLNVLHLHLSDDQGWRIEIKSYPNLTTVGAATQVGGAHPPSGTRWYYTQDEMKDHGRLRRGPQDHHHAGDRHARPLPGGHSLL